MGCPFVALKINISTYMKKLIYQVLFLHFIPFLSFSQEPAKLLTSTKFNNGELIPEAKTASEWDQLSMSNQPVFMKKLVNGTEYYFYNWYAISDIRGVENEKWMIPNQNEIIIWNAYSPIEITPIGIVSEQGAFTKVTEQQYFWTNSEYTDKGKRESAFSFSISTVNNDEIELKQAYKQEGLLVLVVEKEKMSIAIKEAAKLMLDAKKSSSTIVNNTTKTETNSTAVNSNTTKDYKTVKIGNQTWMTENLNVDRFRNGDLIPEAKTGDEWELAGKNKQPAWCYYDNDPANGEKYGKLYNWFAVNDSRGLAPAGYHVPSDSEWITLSAYLGGENVAGDKMKSSSGWNENGNGTNSSGFSGLPGGNCGSVGSFSIGLNGYWWSSSEFGTFNAWYRDLDYKRGDAYRESFNKTIGFSVRCLKD
jgi:uncharacterized protein (TIGR02145 family)